VNTKDLVIDGLTKIRYGSMKDKIDWLVSNFPDTFDVDWNDFLSNPDSTCRLGSLDMWIASSLLDILQDGDV
jgi:hypothetical protein